MYLLLSHPVGWRHGAFEAVPGQAKRAWRSASSDAPTCPSFVLHLEQNRSPLPQEARLMLLILLALAFVSTLGPALRGSLVVPIGVLAGMAALLVALERHRRLPVPFERIEIDDRSIRILSQRGLLSELPSHWARIEQVRPAPMNLRLMLRCRDRSVELGRCLGIDERQAIAPLIAAALAHMKGGGQ